MNDAVKHTTGTIASGIGFFGSITVADHVVSLTCGILGSIAAALTIYSWVKRWLEGKE